MKKKDVIIRVSGGEEDALAFLKELVEESKLIGLDPETPTINKVPEKIQKKDLKNKKAKDVKLSVIGEEDIVELFLETIIGDIDEEIGLANPSTYMKLENDNG